MVSKCKTLALVVAGLLCAIPAKADEMRADQARSFIAGKHFAYSCFDGVPEFRHYNPIGTVHGGFAATLLDSALGCAIFTTLAKGEAWTTLELKLNLVRPISKGTGTVKAEGRIIHRGRTVATSDGTLKDGAGKLYAHATTTCMIFPAKPA